MKRINLIITILFTLFITSVSAQHQEHIKHDAELMAQAMLKGDYKTVASYTHPRVVASMGGAAKMVAVLNKEIENMKSHGATFAELTIGEPGQIVAVKQELYAVVPQMIVMQVNAGKFSTSSSLLAYSANKGKTWYFVDAGNLSDAKIKQLFPAVYGKINIPKQTKPMMMGN